MKKAQLLTAQLKVLGDARKWESVKTIKREIYSRKPAKNPENRNVMPCPCTVIAYTNIQL